MEDLKRCVRCQEWKSRSEFSTQLRKGKPYTYSICKPCNSQRVIDDNASQDPAERRRRVRFNNLSRWVRKLGVPYEVLVQADDPTRRCDICGRLPTDQHQRLHIDHDHSAMKFRGIICNNCNQGLGHFQDNPEWLRAAAEYLERSQE